MKIEDKITFWMPHNTKLQIYKIELIHTVLKKTSFSLNIFGEIHTKNAI